MGDRIKNFKFNPKKIIVITLLFTMVFNFLPISVFAIEIKDKLNEIPLEKIEDIEIETGLDEEKIESKIIGEDEDKRTLNEKHFMMEDGTTLAAIYPTNIHYEKDNKLEEIDNSLKEKNDTEKIMILEEDSAINKIKEEGLEFDNLEEAKELLLKIAEKEKTKKEIKQNNEKLENEVQLEKNTEIEVEKIKQEDSKFDINQEFENTNKVELINSSDENLTSNQITEAKKNSEKEKLESKNETKKDNFVSKKIDTLIEKEKSVNEGKIIENTSNSFDIKFSKYARNKNIVKMTLGNNYIKWALKDADNDVVDVTKSKNKDKKADETVVENVNSTVLYKDILDDIDLRYDVEGESVKESIIVKDKSAAKSEIVFEYSINENLKMKLMDDKSIIVFDGNEDNIVFKIDPLFMYDNSLEFSSDIDMKLLETEARKILG